MTGKPTSLSKSDIRDILAHLQACTNVLDKHLGEMTAMELAFKSMLGAVKRELNEQLKLSDPADD